MALLVAVVSGCGPAASSSPPAESWTLGDYSIEVPADWTVLEEPDADGFNVVEPPNGDGRMLFIEIVDAQAPAVTAEYALREATKGRLSASVP